MIRPRPTSGGDAAAAGKQLTVYSSVPLQGASRVQTTAVVNGAKLALEQAGNKAGSHTIKYDVARRLHRAGGQLDAGAGVRERS